MFDLLLLCSQENNTYSVKIFIFSSSLRLLRLELIERTEKIFGKGWRPEIDTMDTFVCSSWYYLRYPDSKNIDESISGINTLIKHNSYNPEAYKILAEAYSKKNQLYKSKLALVNYYNLKGNTPMAFKVIDAADSSDQLSAYEKEYLQKLKNSILCTTNPPLEPIFGNKTCN